jgi:hypothetical protein
MATTSRLVLTSLSAWSGKTLPELAQLLHTPSVDLAPALVGLEAMGLVEQHQGTWWRVAAPAAAASLPTYVFVDLGNVHDCLQRLLPLAEAGELQVQAFADLAFNGFGVNPPLCASGCKVVRATSPDKNAADVQLVWNAALLCAAATSPLRLFVVTRDHGFRHLQTLAEAAGHHLRFAQDWASLRALLLESTTSPYSPTFMGIFSGGGGFSVVGGTGDPP